MVADGLTEVKTEALKALLKAVHNKQIECPVTPAGVAAVGLQYTDGPLLSTLRGLDDRAVRAVLVAVLAERMHIERKLRQFPPR